MGYVWTLDDARIVQQNDLQDEERRDFARTVRDRECETQTLTTRLGGGGGEGGQEVTPR
jgi:hypothetical protein